MLDFLGQRSNIVIAMAHIGALPGSPLFDPKGGMRKLIDDVGEDVRHLQANGVHAIMFGNENDRPYRFKAPPESLAAMTAIISALKPDITLPFGVNFLWDPTASVAIAVATGAAFVREIFTGLFASDMGLCQPNAADALKLRAESGRADLKLLFNINAEFADPLDRRPIDMRARSAVFSSLADAILVSGPITGQPAETSDLRKVAAAVREVPVLANTGVNVDNVTEVMSIAAGVVIGTHLKVDGITWNPVDPARVRRFMDKVATLP
jgi:membrane complex biogenesis BtpA family protein